MGTRRELVVPGRIAQAIYSLRSQKVMLDIDLALLYGVAAGHLNRAVKRNPDRFPADFMFRLNRQEAHNLKCQIGISSWGGRRQLPYAFTEQGVAFARVAHASRVLVSASRRNELFISACRQPHVEQNPQRRDAVANERDARATR